MVRTQHCCDTWPGSGDNSEVSTTRGHQAVRSVMCRGIEDCGVIGEITWTNGNPSPISVSALLMLVRKDTCKLKHQIQRTLIRIIYLI